MLKHFQLRSSGQDPILSPPQLSTGINISGAAIKVNRLGLILGITVGCILLGGCKSGDGDPNYSTEVKMTAEQKEKMEADAKNRPAPGTVDKNTGLPLGEPGKIKSAPGKSH